MMIENAHETTNQPEQLQQAQRHGGDRIVWAVLWTIWTLMVAASGYLYWRGAIEATQTVDLVGLFVRMLLVGTVGLVVLTLIEQRLAPHRFIE